MEQNPKLQKTGFQKNIDVVGVVLRYFCLH